ncbi:MAG: hypothetical protein FJW30_19850 [Acidobacteria bacterium]|nr:hypothetical protein [Acidobacteriota bacterium]
MRISLFLAALSLAAAPTPDEILAKARAALGKPDDIKTLSLQGSRRTAMPGADTTFNPGFPFWVSRTPTVYTNASLPCRI